MRYINFHFTYLRILCPSPKKYLTRPKIGDWLRAW